MACAHTLPIDAAAQCRVSRKLVGAQPMRHCRKSVFLSLLVFLLAAIAVSRSRAADPGLQFPARIDVDRYPSVALPGDTLTGNSAISVDGPVREAMDAARSASGNPADEPLRLPLLVARRDPVKPADVPPPAAKRTGGRRGPMRRRPPSRRRNPRCRRKWAVPAIASARPWRPISSSRSTPATITLPTCSRSAWPMAARRRSYTAATNSTASPASAGIIPAANTSR